MKKRVLFLAVGAVLALASCTTFKSLPENDLRGIVSAQLGGQSQVEPLQLALKPEYSDQRITLTRTIVYNTNLNGVTSATPASDSALGLDFGNGLYLDNNDNLTVVVSRFLGLDDTFVGKTKSRNWIMGGAGGSPIETTTTYSPGKLEFETKGLLLGGGGTVTIDNKKASGLGETIFFNAKNTKLQPSLFIPLVSREYTWEKTSAGYRKSWSLIDSVEYSLADGKITDRNKSFVVENTGEYLRFQYTKGDRIAYRIYRVPGKVLILDENKGSFTTVTIDGKTATWQIREHNVMGATEKLLDCSLTVLD
jgi:hypothetical protein